MRIFVLEDDQNRIQSFRKALAKHQVVYCDNVDMAKAIFLREDPFDIIFFDHDLDNRQMVDSREENTGYQLALWLKEKNFTFDQIIIHSMNPAGAKNIQDTIIDLAPEVKWIPFCNLISQIS